tara:strand:- start:4446 stop:4595 length:150 start_codon:yes stop_codon:yes gene_type:complete
MFFKLGNINKTLKNTKFELKLNQFYISGKKGVAFKKKCCNIYISKVERR